jgi:hypothetical protein
MHGVFLPGENLYEILSSGPEKDKRSFNLPVAWPLQTVVCTYCFLICSRMRQRFYLPETSGEDRRIPAILIT